MDHVTLYATETENTPTDADHVTLYATEAENTPTDADHVTLYATGAEITPADAADLTRRYRLITWGEAGQTNLGRVTASAGSITVPATVLPVNSEHDRKRPVGTMTVTEHPEGLDAEVTYLATTAGKDHYIEAGAGLRAGISVELDRPVIRAGALITSTLTAAGSTIKPAFPSSLLTASAPDTTPERDTETAETTTPAGPPLTENTGQLIASALAAMAANTPPEPAGPLTASEGVGVDDFTAAVFGLDSITHPQLKAAALDTITQADMYDPTSVPQYIGELWDGAARPDYWTQRTTPATLTAATIEGWRIVKKPTVGAWEPPYSGTRPNETMNDIPTSEVLFEKYTERAKRYAGGNRFDRIHVDFPNPEAMAAYLREEAQSAKDFLNARAKTFLLSKAVKKNATGTDAADPFARLVFGVAWAMEYGIPDFVTVGNDLWRTMKNTARMDVREYLAAELGLEAGTLDGLDFKPAGITETDMNGRLIVGTKRAVKCYTPAGGMIRVDAQELQKGAVDKAVFGYYAFTSDPAAADAAKPGIVEVTATAA